jgi:glycosyltransferase involved in cell wall biosynthesis
MSISKQLQVLFISTDREIFREGSEVRGRMKDFASIAEELTIIVFSKSSLGLKPIQIAPNCHVYPTNSLSRWLYVFDAYRIAMNLFSLSNYSKKSTAEAQSKVALNLVSTQDPFECGIAGYRIAKKLRIPLHLQIHTDFLNDRFQKGSKLNYLRKYIAKFLFREHADIRAVSERIKASIFKKMSFRPNAFPRVEVFPVYVDSAHFRDAVDTVHLSKKYPGHDLLILMVSRLEKEKNIELAIQIVAVAHKRNAEAMIGLILVGEGSQKEALKQYAEKYGVADRVYFEGAVSDPAPYYKSADVLLVTSLYEGYGRQIAEAIAAGCLVVTRDVGAAREIVKPSSGIVCREDDEECLLHNILLLAGNHLVRDQFKNSAHTVSQHAFVESKEQYLERYKKVWEKAVLNEEFNPYL